MAYRLGTPGRNAAADGLAAIMNTGLFEIYDSAQPTEVGDAAGGDKLASCTFGATAFGAASVGTVTANAITSATALESGTALSFRIRDVGDANTIADGTAGTGVSNDLVFDNEIVVSGGTVDITGFTMTVPI